MQTGSIGRLNSHSTQAVSYYPLGQLDNFFESQFLHLQNGTIPPHLKGLVGGLSQVMNYSAVYLKGAQP